MGFSPHIGIEDAGIPVGHARREFNDCGATATAQAARNRAVVDGCHDSFHLFRLDFRWTGASDQLAVFGQQEGERRRIFIAVVERIAHPTQVYIGSYDTYTLATGIVKRNGVGGNQAATSFLVDIRGGPSSAVMLHHTLVELEGGVVVIIAAYLLDTQRIADSPSPRLEKTALARVIMRSQCDG